MSVLQYFYGLYLKYLSDLIILLADSIILLAESIILFADLISLLSWFNTNKTKFIKKI